MNKKEIYRTAAAARKEPRQTVLAAAIVLLAVCAVFCVAPLLPCEWLFEIAAIGAGAFYINKILRRGPFTVTYILYEDRLIELTGVGVAEIKTGDYPLGEARFFADRIIYKGITKEFYPDDKLKSLLKLQ